MGSGTDVDLNALTDNQQGLLKVLADADGETLTGVEVRERLESDYNISLTKNAMNAVFRRTSNYPRHMVDITLKKPSTHDVEVQHATHRLKKPYIDTVRTQLQR